MMEANLDFYMLTVRGTYMNVKVTDQDENLLYEETFLGSSLPGGWNNYPVAFSVPDETASLTVAFTSEFPQQSLGWKMKGINLVLDEGDNLIENPCFVGSLDGWDNPSGHWSLSVAGGTKNLIEGVCDDTRYAAKHGPQGPGKNGNGEYNVPATLSQTVTL